MTETVTTLESYGFDEAVTGLVTRYFTRRDRSMISGGSDTPAKMPFFEPRMVNAGTFDLFMFGNARLGGAGSARGRWWCSTITMAVWIICAAGGLTVGR